MDATNTLIEYIYNAGYDDLPPAAIRTAKRSMLDGIGVMLAGSRLGEGCGEFAGLARSAAHPQQSSVLGFGFKSSILMAALANGAASHALDFEESHDEALGHPNAAALPALIAVAEASGEISGRDFLAALALGSEFYCRLALSFDTVSDEHWWIPPILQALSASVACCKLMRLSPSQYLDAISLTFCQATGSREVLYSPRSHIRSIRDGLGAHAAVLSAQLASHGIRGYENPIEGRSGIFQLYAKGHFDPDVLTRRLGREFEMEKVSYKPWPSCRGSHSFVEAGTRLMSEFQFKAEDIDDIVAVGSSFFTFLVEPRAQKIRPTTAIEAKFSLPFILATLFRNGTISLDDFDPDRLDDPASLALAQRVSYVEDVNLGPRETFFGALRIKLRNGQSIEERVNYPLGHPNNPVSDLVLQEKFRACAKRSLVPPDEADIEAAIVEIEGIDRSGGMGPLIERLSPSRAA